MNMLPLDDPRWRELDHRAWSEGQRSHTDAPFVPDELAALSLDPDDIERFQKLWPYLCSEGTTWPASFAAAPYLAAVAARLAPRDRFEHVYVLGLMAICSASCFIPEDLIAGYEEALASALPLLAETLLCVHDEKETIYLMAAAAGLKGHVKLGEALNTIFPECPHCGKSLLDF